MYFCLDALDQAAKVVQRHDMAKYFMFYNIILSQKVATAQHLL